MAGMTPLLIPKPLPKRRPRRDTPDPALVLAVLERDKRCVLSILEPFHQCKDKWGNPHRSDAVGVLTVEHVKSEPRMGKRATSDLAHMVAMCFAGNVGVPSKLQRMAIREYLERVNAND